MTGRFRIAPSPCTRGTSMRSGSTRAALRSWASPRTARPLPAAASSGTRAADRRGCFERLRAWRMLPGCVPTCRATRSRVPNEGTSRPVSPKASRASVTWRSARCLVWTTCTRTCTRSSYIVSFVQKPVFDVFEGDTIGGYITIFAVDKDGKEHEIQECARRSRSEERRVGKECRSRWSPYH